MSIATFSAWLEATPLSVFLQTREWIIPTVQTIHILSISVVVGSVLMVHLHTLGIAMRSQSSAVLARRFFPWLWVALVVLLLSGSILMAAEPRRSLPNPVFQLKMGLVILAVGLTLLYQGPLRKDPGYWSKSNIRRSNAAGIAIVSLLIWVGIVFAGRWIAYAVEG
jgi:putative copper export protein